MTIQVEQVYCSNRTLRVSYFATKEFGDDFVIRFCESGTQDRSYCKVALDAYDTNKVSIKVLYDQGKIYPYLTNIPRFSLSIESIKNVC